MRKVLMLLIGLFFLHEGKSQVEITGTLLVCPGESISYGAYPASVGECSYRWTVTNGMFSNGSTTIEGYNLLDVKRIATSDFKKRN